MSNFTTSWKFLEKLEKAGKLEFRQIWDRASWKRAGKLDAKPMGELEPPGELEKFVKFYISWKPYASQIYTSWKL